VLDIARTRAEADTVEQVGDRRIGWRRTGGSRAADRRNDNQGDKQSPHNLD
jgi:hypothetical protein